MTPERPNPATQVALPKAGVPAGRMVLLVGPSGAGKDTLLAAARIALAGDNRIVFTRRVITRAVDDPQESYTKATPAAFERDAAAGAFLLSWHAHGNGYGIPITARDDLARKKVVVANVSRSTIGEAETLLGGGNVVVVHITAPIAILANRIAARGRDPVDAIEARLRRQPRLTVTSARVVEIVNDGSVERAAGQLTETLRAIADEAAASS